jgi:uncharacterized protein YpuA (DUF1002 family)
MRGRGNKKAINDARDIGGRNKISEVMELVAKNEMEYDNIINDKPGYDNDRANELLVDAIKNLNSLVSET